MPPVTRRGLLQIGGGVCLGCLAGCLGDTVDAGTLMITNDDDRSHTLTVVVTKASDSDSDVPPRSHEAPGPTTTLWRREFQFELSTGDTHTEPGFLTEPGAYYIEATTATGLRATNWLGLYAAGPDGDQIAESFVDIRIYEYDEMSIGTPTDD